MQLWHIISAKKERKFLCQFLIDFGGFEAIIKYQKDAVAENSVFRRL